MVVRRSPGSALVRHGEGFSTVVRALASQVHPVFMLPPVACSLLGAALAGGFAPGLAAVHAVAIFAAVYTAHVKDGYVDFHVRGEDDDHPLTVRGCRLALAGATTLFAACLVAVGVVAGPVAAALTLPTWVVGYLHAPQLDVTPVGATMGYPAGVALSLLGGYAVQTGTVTRIPVAVAVVLLILLTGVKVVDDGTDYDYDRSIGKRTVPVVLGRRRARRFGFGLLGVAMILVLGFAAEGTLPAGAAVAPLVFGAVAAVASRGGDGLATMLLVRGSYLFLAALVVAVWFRPLAGVPLPDVGVFGRYTYLVTEVVFGAVALALLVRAGALRSAARTVVVLYPVAYLWDWYTLSVGVFTIRLRTGVDLLGIPVEEHLFVVVVPALVLGVHESLRGRDATSRQDAAPRRQPD